MNQLHKGVKWAWRVRSYGGLILFGIFMLIFSSISMFINHKADGLIFFIVIYSLFVFLNVIISEIYFYLSYKNFKYEFDQIQVKIEKGIIWKKYTSIPYERIQNIDIKRGVLARMFGFSRVDLETAGSYGYGGNSQGFRVQRSNSQYTSEGHLPAVSIKMAEDIRNFVMHKITNNDSDGM